MKEPQVMISTISPAEMSWLELWSQIAWNGN